MTNNDDIEAIRLRFLETFGDDMRFVFDAETLVAEEGETYAQLLVMPVKETAYAMYPRKVEAKGRVYLMIYVPVGQPLRPARTKEALFVSAFREWKSDDDRIHFEFPDHMMREGKVYNTLETSIVYRALH